MLKSKKVLNYFREKIRCFKVVNSNLVEHNNFRKNNVCKKLFIVDKIDVDVIDFVCEKFFDIKYGEKQAHIEYDEKQSYIKYNNNEKYC